MTISLRPALSAVCLSAALALAACGDDDSGSSTSSTASAAASASDLAPIKTYLLEHTASLKTDVAAIRADAEAYHELAQGVDFDYAALLRDHRAEVAQIIEHAQAGFAKANPAYEQMEGVVAGVPSLADYDVIIDAGSDASDPESAVPFDIETPAGETYKQPGNFNYLVETSLFGTEPKFAAQGVEPDLDGDGEVEFGEAVPNADFFVAAARDFETNVNELDEAAHEWEPTAQDAFTALVVMTPTMAEYFEAWKNSRFVAGDQATEKAFVVASRLQDIRDILGGLVLVYDSVEPSIAEVDGEQAQQTGASLRDLHGFAGDLLAEEDAGRKFTAEEADTLGSEAQSQAEAIAGQVSQAAGRLNIALES